MTVRRAMAALIVLLGGAWARSDQPAALRVWAVDPLEKVFRDAQPGDAGEPLAEVARGETATFQLVVRSDTPIAQLKATCAPFRLSPGATSGPAALEAAAIRFVGYVLVDRLAQTPARDHLRKPPMDYPDPLLEDVTLDVPAGNAQPVWITVPVPATAAPGDWQAVARLIGRVDGAEAQVELNLTLRVFPAVVGRSRLWVTNWFVMHWPHMAISPLPDSQEYWDLLRRYARNMAAHRQNVVIISPLDLAKYTLGPDGDLDIDFARFDRWVQVFTEEGVIGRIEGAHLGGRSGNWESPFLISIREVKDGQVTARTVEPSAPEAERFYSRFLPALVKHLRERGWAGIYMQHLADEPIASNTASYRAMAELVHRHAPELRIIEACHTKDLVGAISVWVPQLNYLQRDYEHYRERQAAGEEVWFYTCIYPQGEYANRFIELPLLKTRLLHWINHRYGITGYLHWGYNYWRTESPFKQTIPPHDGTYLPAGDSWIVYPGREGPLDSIRFETMRDGIADYELLSLLADRDPDAAATLSRRHVIEFDRYDVDVRAFRDTRRELLRRLSQAPTR